MLISQILLAGFLLAQPARKSRPLTAEEAEAWQQHNTAIAQLQNDLTRQQLEREVLARRWCESIHVELADCGIENGVVAEKPKTPPAKPAETPKPEAKPAK